MTFQRTRHPFSNVLNSEALATCHTVKQLGSTGALVGNQAPMHPYGSWEHEDRNEVELTDVLNDFRKSMLFCLVHENVLASLIMRESILPSEGLQDRRTPKLSLERL